MDNSDRIDPPKITQKKRQHYVPRCYLRQFSVQRDEVRIGVYVLAGGKFIPAGALGKQAYEDFFYGKDGFIEDALEKLEGATAPLLKRIAQERTVPSFTATERESLLTFIAVLDARTKSVIEANEEVFSSGLSAAFGAAAGAAAEQAGGRDAAISASLKTALKLLPLYRDLESKVLVNSTPVPFITSDTPVIKYNQFLEGRTSREAINSLNFWGIQVFLPVSPGTCLMLYDPAVYGVGSRDAVSVVVQEQDALELNRLQAAAADTCVYFDHTVGEPLVASIARAASSLRQPEQGAEKLEIAGKTVIRLFRASLRAGLKLSFVKVLRRARRWDLGDVASLVRHPEYDRALAEWTRRMMPSLSATDENGEPVKLRVVPPPDIR